jgi:hypothetical protein
LNSGIQDADNLIWKLAFAMKHTELNCQALLNSYDIERRPIGERVAKTSLYNMQAHALILDEAIGLSPTKSKEENVEAVEEYFDLQDKDRGLAKRQEVEKALQHLDVEFYAHGAEVGWFYDLEYDGTYGSTNEDENPQVKDDGEMELCTYHPTLRPGSQLPHVWLISTSTGEKMSARELMSRDKLILLTMSPTWKKVKTPLIDVKVLDTSDGDYSDLDGTLKSLRGDEMQESGALLVRPDGIIGYRFPNDIILKEPKFEAELETILRRVLGFKTR